MATLTTKYISQERRRPRRMLPRRAPICALVYALLCVLLLTSCSSEDTPTVEQTNAYASFLRVRSSELDSIERSSISYFSEQKIPAAVTAIINRGDIIHLIEHGVGDLAYQNPVRGNTVFQVAGLSRVFTAVIAQNLIQDGTLDPNAQLVSYLRSAISEEAAQRLNGITLANLLHHQSGFPLDHVQSSGTSPESGGDPLTEEGLAQFLETVELLATPGEQYLDTAWDYTVLAYVLELASGSSYRVLLHKFVTGPFGLFDTDVAPSRSDQLLMARAYQPADRSRAVEPRKPGRRIASSGLYSTVQDVSRLMILQMKAYQSFSRSNLISPLLTTINQITIDADQREGYGLSIYSVNYAEKSYDMYVRNGEAYGFAGSYLFIPALDVGVVTLASSGGSWIAEQQSTIVDQLLGLELPQADTENSSP